MVRFLRVPILQQVKGTQLFHHESRNLGTILFPVNVVAWSKRALDLQATSEADTREDFLIHCTGWRRPCSCHTRPRTISNFKERQSSNFRGRHSEALLDDPISVLTKSRDPYISHEKFTELRKIVCKTLSGGETNGRPKLGRAETHFSFAL